MTDWYEHRSPRRPAIRHAYRDYEATRAECGVDYFHRALRPARRNSATPQCKRCASIVGGAS